MFFKLITENTKVGPRAGEIETPHGIIPTPIFMPVGTVGTVKAVLQKDLKHDIDAKIILGNTYHLYLRPGQSILEQAKGLHNFMNWDRPILTDSGGFQVFSLSEIRKIREEGVEFRSHIDGSKHLFTPENVVDIQRIIGADIIMALDECPPGDCSKEYARKSLKLTQRWLERGVAHFKRTQPLYGYQQQYFPIVQGAGFADLRKESARHVAELDTAGNAIGGLSVGEPTEIMYEMVEVCNEILPVNKPRYLMGVGTPANILEAIDRGVDMFDCVMPTRNGRNGMLFTWDGIINIKNKKWENDFTVVDPKGKTYVDTNFTRAYLRHLFQTGESLGPQIASIHNLGFYLRLVEQAREQIIKGNFASWKKTMLSTITTRL